MLWQLRDRVLDLGKSELIMGIVNVTPDSFSDGGQFVDADAAVAHGVELAAQGADILDIGGESTRPGAKPVAVDEELRRVIPVVRALAKKTSVPVSVDTSKAEVARQALTAGASIINDITALLGDPDMPGVVRDAGAGVVMMHMQGTPQTMQINPSYTEVVAEVGEFLEARLQAVEKLGIAPVCVAVDPGIGFGKTAAHNWELVVRLGELARLGRPICLGVSRKGFLSQRHGLPASERIYASLAVACHSLAHQTAQIFRVHDVTPTRDAIGVFRALRASSLFQ